MARIIKLFLYGVVFVCLIFRVGWILGRRWVLKRSMGKAGDNAGFGE